jgi:hypothetical protein
MEVFSLKNLHLAWRRINTGTGPLCKKFFRRIYLAYEIAIDENLTDLYERLKGGSYEPREPIRFYIPKLSGLQRPITLLSLEDQIIFQCIANIFAEKLRYRREKVQYNTVYSNILQPKKSIFFVKDWHVGYQKFQTEIKKYYNEECRWIAYFDLAAFYDTICHDLLFKMVSNIKKTELGNLSEYLLKWSSSKKSENHGHGLPQGVLASDFLADCFLLPLDESLISDNIKYLRYCDDIRVFGRSENEVRKAVIKLEIYLRERGLIPQGAKHEIKQVYSIKDALGSLPSIKDDIRETPFKWFTMSPIAAYNRFRSALKGRPLRIIDKSRIRHVLYHASSSYKLTRLVLKQIYHHPEHIDSFIYYLNDCTGSKRSMSEYIKILKSSPYEYVQGEIWHLIAINFRFINQHQRTFLLRKAMNIIKRRNYSIPLKWGVMHFLCQAEKVTFQNYSRFIKYQDAFTQALSVPMLPKARYEDQNVISQLLKRTSFEPSIMLAEQFVNRRMNHNNFHVNVKSLPSQTQNIYRKLRLIRGPKQNIDPMGELLHRRYEIPKFNEWRSLLGNEYTYALQLLNQADAVYDLSRSRWLQEQNAFNHTLFAELYSKLIRRNLIVIDNMVKSPEEAKTFHAYGPLLNKNKNFSKRYPVIGEAFRVCNIRRNTLPGSHPYDNSGQKNKLLTVKERSELTDKLREAYTEILKVIIT